MKKKTESYYSDRIKGFVAFRNDIEEVLNILTDNGLSITFQDDKHYYDNIDEIIRNVGNSPKTIIIEARNKDTFESVRLNFDKNELLINCIGSEQMYSLGFRLKNYFSKTIPWHYKVFNPWIFYFTTIPLIFTITLAFDKATNELTRPWILVLFAISSLFGLFSCFLRKKAYGIKLVRIHEHGFWKRNKDNLIVTLISTLIGVALGVIGTLLVEYFKN